MLVNIGLVGEVVVASDGFPAIRAKEVPGLAPQLAEGFFGLEASEHAKLPPGLGSAHVGIAALVISCVVVDEGLRKLPLDKGGLQSAIDDVVSFINGSFGPAVKQACAELRCGVGGQTVIEELVVSSRNEVAHAVSGL